MVPKASANLRELRARAISLPEYTAEVIGMRQAWL